MNSKEERHKPIGKTALRSLIGTLLSKRARITVQIIQSKLIFTDLGRESTLFSHKKEVLNRHMLSRLSDSVEQSNLWQLGSQNHT